MNWGEIERLAAGGVAIGGHSHRHLDGRDGTAAQLMEEAAVSRDVIQRRLGADHGSSYAYPYGSTRLGEVPGAYVTAVKAAGYLQAVTTDLGIATPESDPYLLPRVEAVGSDSRAVIRAKVSGSLMPLYVTDRLRNARRSA
jgi:hypothetical protein